MITPKIAHYSALIVGTLTSVQHKSENCQLAWLALPKDDFMCHIYVYKYIYKLVAWWTTINVMCRYQISSQAYSSLIIFNIYAKFDWIINAWMSFSFTTVRIMVTANLTIFMAINYAIVHVYSIEYFNSNFAFCIIIDQIYLTSFATFIVI